MKQNFLLGKGERLAEDIVVRNGGAPKEAPYTFGEARARLAPRLAAATNLVEQLPAKACPNDQTVISLTLNPEYLSKSAYPHDLLKAVGLTPVGSKPRKVKPEKRSRMREPVEAITTELFVMTSRKNLRAWCEALPMQEQAQSGAKDLPSIEDIEATTPNDKIKGDLPSGKEGVFEVVLHASELEGEKFVLPYFDEYLRSLGLDARFNRRFYAGGLCFIELEAPTALADEIATFSVVRALREMPRLRMLRPTIRASAIPGKSLMLPTEPAMDQSIRVAIFDGGIPGNHPITAWATPIEGYGVGNPTAEFIKHGTGVTSAILFGHLDPRKPIPQPYANTHHYRVLDDVPGQNSHELYDVLDRIDRALSGQHYHFINLSLGPQLPVEDDDVHAWTAVLDDRLAKSDTLATIAVGNDGESDPIVGLNRIQVPADCVNALAIGACDSPDDSWQRAPYSSIGPGRSPGLVKPDLVEFGGSIGRPFLVLSANETPELDATGGTSFSAPSALRLGMGIRAHFGDNLNLLTIRSLLIHQCERSDHPRTEIGWGRLSRNLEDIVICDDDTIRVVYQGKISPAKYIRIPIPMPNCDLNGNVCIKATLCYKSYTDPHHPGNYTRAGLEPTFRPHDGKFSNNDQLHPNTLGFFGRKKKGMAEEELRRDAWKWENCLNAQRTLRGTSLSNPVFDLHYNARMEGHDHRPDNELSYAMVVSVQAKNIQDFYDQVVRKYATQLEPIKPVIHIPVRA